MSFFPDSFSVAIPAPTEAHRSYLRHIAAIEPGDRYGVPPIAFAFSDITGPNFGIEDLGSEHPSAHRVVLAGHVEGGRSGLQTRRVERSWRIVGTLTDVGHNLFDRYDSPELVIGGHDANVSQVAPIALEAVERVPVAVSVRGDRPEWIHVPVLCPSGHFLLRVADAADALEASEGMDRDFLVRGDVDLQRVELRERAVEHLVAAADIAAAYPEAVVGGLRGMSASHHELWVARSAGVGSRIGRVLDATRSPKLAAEVRNWELANSLRPGWVESMLTMARLPLERINPAGGVTARLHRDSQGLVR